MKQGQFPNILPLTSLNGQNGFKIDGEAAGDIAGGIRSAGDVNGDGRMDLIVGASYCSWESSCGAVSCTATGHSYVIFGGPGVGQNGVLSLSSLNGTNGFKINGEAAGDASGYFAATGAGDVNNDGFDDLIIGAFRYNGCSGRSYVIFGGSQVGASGVVSLSGLNGTNGFKIDGETAGDYSGLSVSAAGDLNNDTIADLVIGAYFYGSKAGRSYVVFGNSSLGGSGLLAVSSLNGVNGFKLGGEAAGDQSGYPVSEAGDVNGDGVDDLLIGASSAAPGGMSSAGRSYLILGKSNLGSSGALPLSTLNGVNGFKLDGEAADLNHANESLVFIPSNVRHGRFETLSNPGIFIANFTQQQISSGEIQFIHDGTLITPNYDMTVRSQGIAWTGPVSAKISFTGVQPSTFPAVIPLSGLNGKTGFKINGEASGDLSGCSAAAIRDFNGDDVTDLLIGAQLAQGGAGRSYVIFGNSNLGSSGLLTLAGLNGVNGFKINGEVAAGSNPPQGDRSGISVSTAGDFNDDGYEDILIGAVWATPVGGRNNAGRSYVVFGGPGVGGGGLLSLSGLNGVNGFKLNGETTGDSSGVHVRSPGDINADGYPDILMGAYGRNSGAGRSYVVYGGPGVGGGGVIDLPNINGANGFKMDGEAGDNSGYRVSEAGDVNGDGYDDLLIGANARNSNIGRTYVVFGGALESVGSGGLLSLSSLNGVNGFKLDGESVSQMGLPVNAVDFNEDGYSDILIGAPGYNASIGRSYVIFGSPTVGAGGLLSLSNLNGSNGFKLDGEVAGDISNGIHTAGDINGDGHVDLLVTASGHGGGAGRIYIVFGGPAVGQSGRLDLANLDGVNGFKLDGEAGSGSGSSIDVGDFNDDGVVDLLIGGPNYNSNVGRSYVVFGDVAPRLNLNCLTVHQNQTLILNAQHLNATDFNHPAAGLRFDLTNVTHGYFAVVNTSQPITTFNQSQLWNSRIQFVHDGSTQASNYTVQVQSDGLALPPPPQRVNMTFYKRPTLLRNTLVTHQGETIRLNSSHLDITDDYPDDQVVFNMSNVQHGRFESAPAVAVAQFTWRQLKSGQISFVHDGGASAPGYQVDISDPYFALGPNPVNVSFYRRPVIVNNRLTIRQGETAPMTSDLLSVMDDYPADQVKWTPGLVQYGQFRLAPLNISVMEFTQAQLAAGQVYFVQDGGRKAPGYQVSVSDPYFTLPSEPVNMSFIPASIVWVNNRITIHNGEQVVLSPAELKATLMGYNDSQLVFLVGDIQQGYFTLTSKNTTRLKAFNQSQVINGEITFVHSGQDQSPAYTVMVTDGEQYTVPEDAEVQLVSAPVITQNNLTIQSGQSIILTPSELNITVADGSLAQQVVFQAQDLQHVWITETTSGKPITNFTLADVQAGKVQVTQDGSSTAPHYTLAAVGENGLISALSAVTARFSSNGVPAPVLVHNYLLITQGENAGMTTQNIYATTNESQPIDGSALFYVTEVTHGGFSVQSLPGFSVTFFSQDQLKSGQVTFAHDDSVLAPSYRLSVRSLGVESASLPAAVIFRPINKPPQLKHSLTDQSTTVGKPFTYAIPTDSFVDPEGETLSYSAKRFNSSLSLPGWLHFEETSRRFTGIPKSADFIQVNVTAQDPLGLSASSDFTINVSAAGTSEIGLSTWQKTIIGAMISGGIGIGFALVQICLKRVANKKLLQILGESKEPYDENVVRPVAKEIAQRIKITRFMNATTNKELLEFKSAVRSLLSALGRRQVNLNFTEMKEAERDAVINEIGNQTYRWMKSKQQGCGARCPGIHSFFKPQLTPESLRDAAEVIADNVSRALQKPAHQQQLSLSAGLSVSSSPVFKDGKRKSSQELSQVELDSPPSPPGKPEEAEVRGDLSFSKY
jgi:hypothetical protein